MSYKVTVTEGKSQIVEPENLDQALKDGCEKALCFESNILVCGRHGSGKTSVLKYFEDILPERMGLAKEDILFLQAYDVIESVISAIQNNSGDALRAKWDSAKAIIVDDIDRLSGKETTQSEFLRLLEKHQMVILSITGSITDIDLIPAIKTKLEGYTSMAIEETL